MGKTKCYHIRWCAMGIVAKAFYKLHWEKIEIW